jgi:uncharacterized protein YbjT (DUF2867 family)
MKVLVYGAAGSQQFPVINALINRGAEVYAVSHTEANISKLNQVGATAILANMGDAERLNEISKGIDAVSLLIPFFLSNPSDGLQYAKNAIDAARGNHVKLLVWNSSGFIPPVKIDILDYLVKSGVPYIVIQPSVYAENLLGPWAAPFVKNEKRIAYPTPEEMPVGWIATQDVAAFIAEAIYKPELAGSSFMVSGLENLTGSQLAEKFSIGLRDAIDYYTLPPKRFGEILDNILGIGAGDGIADFYQYITDTKQYPIMFVPEMPSVLEKLPIRMTSIEEWVSKNSAAFK